jgi:Rieske Fe-S protein
MIRRTFLGLGLMLLGFGRRAWAQVASAPPVFRPLTKPVRIPLDKVATPWIPVSFTAEGARPPDSPEPGRRVLMSGVLFRRDETGNDRPALSALCVICPHELCNVDLVTDPPRLARMSVGVTHPLFECGCHFSVFDALEDGRRVSGPTPRGLYRFRVSAVSDGTVEINEVEEAALSEL